MEMQPIYGMIATKACFLHKQHPNSHSTSLIYAAAALFINLQPSKKSIMTGPSARAHFLQSITLLAKATFLLIARDINQATTSIAAEKIGVAHFQCFVFD